MAPTRELVRVSWPWSPLDPRQRSERWSRRICKLVTCFRLTPHLPSSATPQCWDGWGATISSQEHLSSPRNSGVPWAYQGRRGHKYTWQPTSRRSAATISPVYRGNYWTNITEYVIELWLDVVNKTLRQVRLQPFHTKSISVTDHPAILLQAPTISKPNPANRLQFSLLEWRLKCH